MPPDINRQALRAMIAHVFLMPQFPTHSEEALFANDLARLLEYTLKRFENLLPQDCKTKLRRGRQSMENFWQARNDTNLVCEEKLITILQKGTAAAIPLYIANQNAGVIIRWDRSEHTIEAFQLSPNKEGIFSTEGRLQRSFPEICVQVEQETACDFNFSEAIAEILAKQDKDYVPGLKPKKQVNNYNKIAADKRISRPKSESKLVTDETDSCLPKHIFDIFFGFLFAHGKQVHGRRIWKNTRDVFEFDEGDSTVLRRSPIWLLLKVTLQQELCNRRTKDSTLYKRVMILFYSVLIELACENEFDSATLHNMCRKIAYRIVKLDDEPSAPWLEPVSATTSRAKAMMQRCWESILETNTIQDSVLMPTFVPSATNLTMPCQHLSQFLQSFHDKQEVQKLQVDDPKSELILWSADKLPYLSHLPETCRRQKISNLVIVEQWVEDYLPLWIQANQGSHSACKSLLDFAKEYFKLAKNMYSGHPDHLSIMYLTLLEIWVACDKSAVCLNPLLQDYKPFTMETIAWPFLLLGTRESLCRLSNAEKYIQDRSYGKKDMVALFGTSDCFSARSADESTQCAELLKQIRKKSCERVQQKKKELQDQKNKQLMLFKQHEKSSCALSTCVVRSCNASCTSCNNFEVAKTMKINIYQDMLPKDHNTRSAVLFELNPRPHFAAWRDFCFFFLMDVAEHKNPKVSPSYRTYLRNYEPLNSFRRDDEAGSGPRIRLASRSSVVAKLQHLVKQDMTFSQISQPCGMRWKLYDADSQQQKYLGDLIVSDIMSKNCAVRLDDDKHPLQQFLYQPLSSGRDLQKQLVLLRHEPQNKTLLKHNEELGSLRLGDKVPWPKLLRELWGSSVDWTTTETWLFIYQLAFEASPMGDGDSKRERHVQLGSEKFVKRLLDAIEARLNPSSSCAERKATCTSRKAIATFTTMAIKMLAESPEECRSGVLRLLSMCRKKIEDMLMLGRGTNDTSPEWLETRLELALIYVYTCNIDNYHLQALLEDEATASVYLFAGILIRENASEIRGQFQSLLYSQSQRLAVNAARELISLARRGKTGSFFTAFSVAFSSDVLAIGEESLVHVSGPWIRGQIKHSPCSINSQKRIIHFNMVTAEVRVDGKAPSRIPDEYYDIGEFTALFQKPTLAAMPSRLKRYPYELKEKFEKYKIFLGTGQVPEEEVRKFGKLELQLLAEGTGGSEFVLIPRRIMFKYAPMIPDKYIFGYCHWYNTKKRSIDFRDMSSPWKMTSVAWRLSPTKDGLRWLLQDENGRLTVIPKTHQHYASFVKLFEHLSDDSDLTVTLDEQSRRLEVKLCRLDLDFFMDAGKSVVQSVQYEYMRIDNEYSLQALVGLRSRLILSCCGGGGGGNSDRRLLLIPFGKFEPCRDQGQGHIQIYIKARKNEGVQVYTIESGLGQLKGNGTLKSKLYLALLHGITSFCLADPFTTKCGQESALDILQSGAVLSLDSLDADECELLVSLSKLSPKRQMRQNKHFSVATCQWKIGLNAWAYHESYADAVDAILDRVEQLHVIKSAEKFQRPQITESEKGLRRADARRKACFRIERYSTSGSICSGKDRLYHFRLTDRAAASEADSEEDSSRKKPRSKTFKAIERSEGFHRAFFAALGANKGVRFNARVASWDEMQEHASNGGVIKGATTHFNAKAFAYDARMMDTKVNMAQEDFCAIHSALQQAKLGDDVNRYRMQLWLSTIAYQLKQDTYNALIPVLCALICHVSEDDIKIPAVTNTYLVSAGKESREKQIIWALNSAKLPFQLSSYKTEMTKKSFETEQNKLMADIAAQVVSTGNVSLSEYEEYLDVFQAQQLVSSLLIANKRWRQYFEKLQKATKLLPVTNVEPPELQLLEDRPESPVRSGYITMSKIGKSSIDYMELNKGCSRELVDILKSLLKMEEPTIQASLQELPKKLTSLPHTPYQSRYLQDIERSTSLLQEERFATDVCAWPPEADYLIVQHILEIDEEIQARLRAVTKAAASVAGGKSEMSRILQSSDAVPRFSLRCCIQNLSRSCRSNFSLDWLACFKQMARLYRQRQHMARIKAASSKCKEELINELRTIGRDEIDDSNFPDAILLEIEQNICLRANQLEIAEQMREPSTNENAMMQLNMGEGKSSVIIPIVSASLSGIGSKVLVRVIVGKAQTKQMMDTMISAIGGLMNRQVFTMPFSRDCELNTKTAKQTLVMLQNCINIGGVLLLQPENHLSLQLSVSLDDADRSLTRELGKMLRLFRNCSRDIIDEADENLSPTYELRYTLGSSAPIEFAPDRWLFLQGMLNLVEEWSSPEKEIVKSSECLYMQSKKAPTKYADIRFLSEEAFDKVASKVASIFASQGLPSFPMERHSEMIREAVLRLISTQKPDESDVELLRKLDKSCRSGVALARGCIAGGLLRIVFTQKRWRVDYGQDTGRRPCTSLAVPFSAKDIPKPRSEFSNPDIVILLTQLSYYNSGLSQDETRELVKHVKAVENGSEMYRAWYTNKENKMTENFLALDHVNLKDDKKFQDEVWPAIRYSVKAIDQFLNKTIFPRELGAFKSHIGASGWDLIDTNTRHIRTAFSGTSDLCAVLPLSMVQRNLASQEHTNALVLNNVLHVNNTVVSVYSQLKIKTSTGLKLLEGIVKEGGIRVILDVGAQFIQLTNSEVARHWLKKTKDDSVGAVIYFDEAGEMVVRDGQGRIKPLKVSPFANSLDTCLVFLDEAHTRGTDLRLPRHYRAAVTLGAGLCKDRLTQGKSFWGEKCCFVSLS